MPQTFQVLRDEKAAQAVYLTINRKEPYGIAQRPLALTKQDYTWLKGYGGQDKSVHH